MTDQALCKFRCYHCGKWFWQAAGRGRPKIYCSRRCSNAVFYRRKLDKKRPLFALLQPASLPQNSEKTEK